MGLESGTYVNDLTTTNPISTDVRSQGDDHLRLIKTVLKSTFPNASKAFYFPEVAAKTANYTVLEADEQTTFVCDASGGAFTLTLPTLGAGLGGWFVDVIKTDSGANPVYVAPASGNIGSAHGDVAKIRVAARNAKTRLMWTGSAWVASKEGPLVGVVEEWAGSSLPPGYVWADGSAISRTDYAELFAALSTTYGTGDGSTTFNVMDRRGRLAVAKDNLGGTAANRIQVSTTIDTTNGSPTATVASATGLTVGMKVFSANVSDGTTITAISGTTLTLSTNASATASGTAARFSTISDPQTLSSTGGEATHTTTSDEMPSHTHTFTGNALAAHGHPARISNVESATSNTDGGFMLDNAADSNYSAHTGTPSGTAGQQIGGASAGTPAGTNSNTGGGLPHNNLPPVIVMNYILRAA